MKDLKPLFKEDVENMHPIIIAGPCSAETEEQVLSALMNLPKTE